MPNNLVRLTVQVTAEQKKVLQELSSRQVIPISAIIRSMINERFTLHQ